MNIEYLHTYFRIHTYHFKSILWKKSYLFWIMRPQLPSWVRYPNRSGVNIFQKTRNYSVRERNEKYKISKLFRSFEKKIGIIPTTFVLI